MTSPDGPWHQYRIKNLAFFFEMPDKQNLTGYYIAGGDILLTSLQEQTDFVFVQFTTRTGKMTRTWFARKGLSPLRP